MPQITQQARVGLGFLTSFLIYASCFIPQVEMSPLQCVQLRRVSPGRNSAPLPFFFFLQYTEWWPFIKYLRKGLFLLPVGFPPFPEPWVTHIQLGQLLGHLVEFAFGSDKNRKRARTWRFPSGHVPNLFIVFRPGTECTEVVSRPWISGRFISDLCFCPLRLPGFPPLCDSIEPWQ